ncbi:MAG: hypothetical protein KA215_03235 [Flavobacterium sp.]|nr:hypothetical protein [Flavobacterium sp.]
MKKFKEIIARETLKKLPVSYYFVSKKEVTDLKKSVSKYVTCDVMNTNMYSAVTYYKPISTVFPKVIEKELNER